MPRGAREKQREQAKKERQRQRGTAAEVGADEVPRGAIARDAAALDPEIARAAAEIADALGETEDTPRVLILRAVQRLGASAAQALLREALAIEEQGGMWLRDGSRRRTPGGVFFILLRERAEKPDRLAIFYPEHASIVPLAPEELAPLLASAAEWQRGPAQRAQVILTGRPARIPPPDVSPETPYVIFNIESTLDRLPSLAKGLPPIEGATTFRVLADTDQWRKLAPQLVEQPDTAISILGDTAINPKRPDVITVRASIMRLVAWRSEEWGNGETHNASS